MLKVYQVGSGGVSSRWRQFRAGGDLWAVCACLLALRAL